MPARYKKAFDIFCQLGRIYGETGTFDVKLVRKLAAPERLSKPMLLLFKLLFKTKLATSYLDNQLKQNGAYERRFDKPYVSGSES